MPTELATFAHQRQHRRSIGAEARLQRQERDGRERDEDHPHAEALYKAAHDNLVRRGVGRKAGLLVHRASRENQPGEDEIARLDQAQQAPDHRHTDQRADAARGEHPACRLDRIAKNVLDERRRGAPSMRIASAP